MVIVSKACQVQLHLLLIVGWWVKHRELQCLHSGPTLINPPIWHSVALFDWPLGDILRPPGPGPNCPVLFGSHLISGSFPSNVWSNKVAALSHQPGQPILGGAYLIYISTWDILRYISSWDIFLEIYFLGGAYLRYISNQNWHRGGGINLLLCLSSRQKVSTLSYFFLHFLFYIQHQRF